MILMDNGKYKEPSHQLPIDLLNPIFAHSHDLKTLCFPRHSTWTCSCCGALTLGTLHSALATSADEIFIWGGIHSAMPFQTLQDPARATRFDHDGHRHWGYIP